jgi:hypothetical protein
MDNRIKAARRIRQTEAMKHSGACGSRERVMLSDDDVRMIDTSAPAPADQAALLG